MAGKKSIQKRLDTRRSTSYTNMSQFNSEAGAAFHIIVQVEFDGRNPGGTYYDRLHAMGIWVNRGNREEFQAPWERRQSSGGAEPQALVMQEGMFSCQNEDVAKRIANIADEAGASVVTIGRYYSTVYRVNDGDLKAYEQYKKGVSKRGPKPIEEQGIYAITCYYEARTFEVEMNVRPFACPCGSIHFNVHFGKGKHYLVPNWNNEPDVFDYWLRSRFGQAGAFEIPLLATAKHKDVPPLTVHGDTPKLPALVEADRLAKAMQHDPELALHVWDVMYCLTHFTELERIKGRLDVITIYMMEDGQKTLFMGLPPSGFDVIDLSILDRTMMQYL